jgi:hypothetical protein
MKYRQHRNKYKTHLCDSRMSFQDCELAILRHAVDEVEKRKGEEIISSPDVEKMIKIVEDFLVRKKLVCYGGTAINNILPKYAQFYDRNIELPDYDFFSANALDDAKELANIYYKNGYTEVDAKAGMHFGTFKVYVNFISVADITQIHPILFTTLKKEAITISGIKYAPPNYLRMGMYLELSRPNGDVTRWEKVLKRINLLNKYYPLKTETQCRTVDFQRGVDNKANISISDKIYYLVRDVFIEQGCIFLGGYGASLYTKYMPKNGGEGSLHMVNKNPDFDVLTEDAERTAILVREKLAENGIAHVKLVKHTSLGEIIPASIEIIVNSDTVAFVYFPLSCHGYNEIKTEGKMVRVATIDTMLSFYLAFLYANKPYLDKERILCMSTYLFNVEQQNRLLQRGLLKRFNTECYGTQKTLEDIRTEKAKMYEELKSSSESREYEMWFLKYNPAYYLERNRGTKTVEKEGTHEIKVEGEEDTPVVESRATKSETLSEKNMKSPTVKDISPTIKAMKKKKTERRKWATRKKEGPYYTRKVNWKQWMAKK